MYIILLQTFPSRDVKDGERRGPEPFDVLLARPVGPHLPLVGKLSGVDEHGHAGYAARVKDSRRSRSTLGFVHSQRWDRLFFD